MASNSTRDSYLQYVGWVIVSRTVEDAVTPRFFYAAREYQKTRRYRNGKRQSEVV